jgi:hypothetical protein
MEEWRCSSTSGVVSFLKNLFCIKYYAAKEYGGVEV